MKEVKVIHHYAKDDLKQMGERVTDLFMDGIFIYKEEDYYHNKIDEKIGGFLDCLTALQIDYKKEVLKISDCQLF